MFALCLDSRGYDYYAFFGLLAVAILLAFAAIAIYVLCKVFLPPSDLPGANMLGLDPEASSANNARFCWSGAPIWKPILYFILAVMTLIY